MAFKPNQYYKIADLGSEALFASEALLKSYPLSKVCLDILGKSLLTSLEFGFFNPGYQLIRQNDRGKDLFLLCNHIADVIVFDKVIVQMEAPSLFGDKAIIDKNSTRNATISVAEGDQSLVIKIPMGLFLRDFKRSDVEDASFTQETQIFYNLFLEIQKRLFKYAEIQKSLWEEVNKQLKLLNVQLIANALSKQEEKDWEPKVWQVVRQYLMAVHGFNWPDSVKYSVKTLTDLLNTILDRKFSKANYKGTDRAYTFQKQTIWQRWLETLSELLVKVLPNNQLPVSIGELELFNPRVYQMRMHTLLVSIQRKFMFKKVAPREEHYDSEKLKAKNFFDSDEAENEFNLDSYLKALSEMFVLKNPNRVLAQVAQQTAQLSATCENEFNTSVSKMKHLLEKVKKLSKVQIAEDDEQEKVKQFLASRLKTINQGFKTYNSRIVGHTYTYAGVIRFTEGKVPLIKDIVKTVPSDPVKKNLTKSFDAIIEKLSLKPDGMGVEQLKGLFYLCQGNSEDVINENQLMKHYWIPASEGICLLKGKKSFGPLKPGMMIGGHVWQQEKNEEGDENYEEWKLQMPKKSPNQPLDDLFLILVIPKRIVPWILNLDPTKKDFQEKYVPLIQWMIQKNLESMAIISEMRDSYIKKYSRVVEVVITEKKVREFENNANKLPPEKYKSILKLVYETLGISLEKKSAITPKNLSKQIYNEIISQTKRDFPKLNPEEQGNKAYTLWRFVQSEIMSKVFSSELKEVLKTKPPESIFLSIKTELDGLLKDAEIEPPEESYYFTEEGGEIKLAELMQSEKTSAANAALSICLGIAEIVDQHLLRLVDETITCRARLKQISSIQTEFNVNEIQSKYILDAISKLRYILQNKSA